MKKTLQLVTLVYGLLALSGLVLAAAPASQGAVYLVPIKGEIDLGLARFVDRAIQEASDARALGVLVEVSTLGGRVDAALEIRNLLAQARLPVAVVVVDRAWSAGVLISLSGQQLFMFPGTSIGAAEPRPLDPKVLSAWRAELETTAERAGRDPLVAASMADAAIEIPGLVAAGQILTLTAKQAADIGFVDGVVASRQEALEAAGWGAARVVEMRQRGVETFSRLVTKSTVAPVLLTLGLFGLIVEVFTPGWGIPGAIGLTFLGLFFGGHLLAGFAGWEVVLLFVLGLVFLSVEAFMPGFGVFGLGGILAMILSIYFTIGGNIEAARTLALSLVSTVLLTVGFIYLAARRGWLRRFALPAALTTASGFVGTAPNTALLGKLGVTVTPLRPAGVARIEEERYDVVSEGRFIPAHTDIVVVRIEGRRTVVRPVEELMK
ncbi:MAG: NfeD family protein [Bacillota bacterium]